MASEESVPLAQDISDAFVTQYFHILEHSPHEARRLYVDSSVVSRPGPDGTMLSFTSVEAINEQFLSCDYANTAFEVLSVDSQYSLDDGIFIMVVGFLTGKDNLKRKFSQMFYLTRDPHQNNAYVVLNDIFRYVDELASAPITIPVVESVPATEMEKPADELNKTEPIHKVDASVEKSVNVAEVKKAAEVENVVAGASPPLDNGKVKHSDEKAVTAQKPKEPVTETAAAAPQPDGAKRSFAAIVQSMARNTAPFQVKAQVQKPRYMGQQPRVAATPQKPPTVSNFEKKTDQKIVEEPGTSIFVANLPMNAMPPQLDELFKDFGPIKENGIQVRSSRATGICFGFVAFESTASVQSVLQAAKNNPFLLADRKLRVKEKQVDYDGSKPSGRSGGGKSVETKSADGRTGSGSRTQNGSADGGDEFIKPSRNRRNGGRNERRGGDRNTNVVDSNQKNSEGGAPEVKG